MAAFTQEEVVQATSAKVVRRGASYSYVAVSTDTRAIGSGALFVALEGERFDAHAFVDQAAKAGAAGAVVQKGKALPPTPEGFALFEVESTLAALGALGRFHRRRFRIPV